MAYYESEEQAKTVLDICSELVFARNIIFENDTGARSIQAVVPVQANTGIQNLEDEANEFVCQIQELQHSFLATPLLDLMPETQLEDKERALFYLEMSMWYWNGIGKCILPIDWFDIRKQWEKSLRFHFSPPVEANSIRVFTALMMERFSGRAAPLGASSVLWILLPENGEKRLRHILQIINRVRDQGHFPLVGIRCIPGHKNYRALHFVLV